jgi:hypothetical protein
MRLRQWLGIAIVLVPIAGSATLRLATEEHGDQNPPRPNDRAPAPYRRFHVAADMQRVQRALEDLCPCLLIAVATKNIRGDACL